MLKSWGAPRSMNCKREESLAGGLLFEAMVERGET